MKKTHSISDTDFAREVIQSEIPVLVDFWAPWCGPCQMMMPLIELLAEAYEGKIKILKLNVDENPLTPAKYGVTAIPTLILFNKGEIVERLIGAQSKDVVENLLKRLT